MRAAGDFLLLLLGPAVMASSFALALQQREPFATYFYLFAWYGLIFFLDRLIRRIEGTSLIARCGPGFVLVLYWSTVTWLFFELLNLRLQNWYYIFAVEDGTLRFAMTMAAFATVFPGIFWIDHVLALKQVASNVRGTGLKFTEGRLRALQLAGVIVLALAMWQPRLFFPLVWSCLALILAPVNYRRGVRGLLRQLEEGDYGPLVRTLIAGMIAGLLWEFFNYWARAKWIYTVPFFDELKLFEMPLAGFLGFPPFAVECVCVYRFLVWNRFAPPFGTFDQQAPARPGIAGRGLILIAAAVGSIAVYRGLDTHTTASLTPRVERAEGLSTDVRRFLTGAEVRYLTELEGWSSERLWKEMTTDLGSAQTSTARAAVRLYLHQGIGIDYGNQLVAAGIHSLGDLRGLSAEDVTARMKSADGKENLPGLPRISVWLRRLPAGE